MEFKPNLYKRACSRLTAPPKKIQEVIAMTEKQRKPKKIVRGLLVAAAIMALAVLGAMGANAATGGELFARIVSYVEYEVDGGKVGKMVIEIDDDQLTEDCQGSFEIYQEGEDSKAYMTYTDENGQKITQEIDLDNLPGEDGTLSSPSEDSESPEAPAAETDNN